MFLARKHGIARQQQGRPPRLESLERRQMLAGDVALELTRFQSDADLEAYLVSDALEDYGSLFDQPAWARPWGCPECGIVAFDADVATFAAPESHSETNTQVAGVDESDLVETDGNYLYVLSGQELLIADAWQPDQMQLLSRVQVEGQPIGQFLSGDRLAVVSNVWDYSYADPWVGGPFIDIAIDVAFPVPWTEPQTRITVFDVADRSNPSVIQTTELDGNYISSRAMGDNVYLISSARFGLPEPEITCEDTLVGEDGIVFVNDGCRYESRESYLERIEGGNVVEMALPHYTRSGESGVEETGLLTAATDIFEPMTEHDQNLITISVFDMAADEPGPVSTTSVPTNYTTTVYASTGSLYLTNPSWGASRSNGEASSILKFDVLDDGGRVDLSAVGEVPGRLLNSFSMDEFSDAHGDKYLRIATTRGWGRDTDNRVFVLQQNDTELDIVGKATSLAPGEQIFSVRFVGETGYVVTFLQTDPLFTIDFSDPTDPRVLGELHIPGFSNYLQPANESFLIGLGRNADPNTGRAEELQVSLFDVSDLAGPKLADRYSFDIPDWAWSEAIGDHHAVSYFPQHQVLAIPVSSAGGWVGIDRNGDGRVDFQSYRPRTDLYVFQLDLPEEGANGEARIELLGTIQNHADVRRSVRIDEFLYSISADMISVHPLRTPDTEINRLYLGQDDVGVELFEPEPGDVSFQLAMSSPEQTAPQVSKVLIAGTHWSPEVINHLEQAEGLDRTGSPIVPFAGTNQVKLQFTEDVYVDSLDLRIRGESEQYSIRNFTYDPITYTAVWTLARPIVADTVSLRLAGVEDISGNRLDGNGNGRADGMFGYEFSVLAGDVDRDGRVDRADVASAMQRDQAAIGDLDYRLSHDIDGNGVINAADYESIDERAGAQLPGFSPPIAGDSNADGEFNTRDLVAVMQGGKYRTGEFATFADGDWNRDGFFDESDLVFAFQQGNYASDPLAAAVDAVFDDAG